jgi:hypothetical protein
MMVFAKPDFTEFVQQKRVYDFRNVKFDELLDHVFKANADWSVAFLGGLKYAAICDNLLPTRATVPKTKPEGVTDVTFTIETNLQMEAYIDGDLVAWSNTREQRSGQKSDKFSFTLESTAARMFEFELYLQLNQVHRMNTVQDNPAFFLKIFVETFNTSKRAVLPSEIYMLTTTKNTLEQSIVVTAAAANAVKSNVKLDSGNWQS